MTITSSGTLIGSFRKRDPQTCNLLLALFFIRLLFFFFLFFIYLQEWKKQKRKVEPDQVIDIDLFSSAMRTSPETVVCVEFSDSWPWFCRWKGGEIALDYRSVCNTTRRKWGEFVTWAACSVALTQSTRRRRRLSRCGKSKGGGDCHCFGELMLEAHTRKLPSILFFRKLFCVFEDNFNK